VLRHASVPCRYAYDRRAAMIVAVAAARLMHRALALARTACDSCLRARDRCHARTRVPHSMLVCRACSRHRRAPPRLCRLQVCIRSSCHRGRCRLRRSSDASRLRCLAYGMWLVLACTRSLPRAYTRAPLSARASCVLILCHCVGVHR
jgi:hypothetical protein